MNRLIYIVLLLTFPSLIPLVSATWLSPDPLMDKYPYISPYAYCNWNPVNRIDPDGRNPIYSIDGDLVGTDETGLQGHAIVMDSKLFVQNMPSDVASAFDLGTDYLSDNARSRLTENYNNLPSRPDWDGILTLTEANNWYRNCEGKPLYVDASKVDLSPIAISDFSTIGSSKYINFLDPKNLNLKTGLVYGTIQVTLIGSDGTVRLGNKNGLLDVYNFDVQNGRVFRNFATQLGSILAGKGITFNIFYYGSGKIK